jgi:hypothetical protein
VSSSCQGELFVDGRADDPMCSDDLNRSVDVIREKYGFASIRRGSTSALRPSAGAGTGIPARMVPKGAPVRRAAGCS